MTLTKDFLIAALTRAIKTMAQTALGMITVGAALQAMDWGQICSVALVAGIYSILTSIVMGVPEAKYDGTLVIDGYGMQLELPNNDQYDKIVNSGQKQVLFKIENPTIVKTVEKVVTDAQ